MPFRMFMLKMYLLKGYTAQKLLKEFPRVGTTYKQSLEAAKAS